MNYNPTVMDHFMNPRNVGEIESPDGVGQVGNPACGDIMKISLRVRDGRIDEVKFKTFGCGAAIANSSMMTEMVKGKKVEEAETLKNTDIAEALGGLPPIKMHCSSLAADALHAALEDYKKKSGAHEEEAQPASAAAAS